MAIYKDIDMSVKRSSMNQASTNQASTNQAGLNDSFIGHSSTNNRSSNKALIAAAMCTFMAAVLHLFCIVFGGEWYLALGAGAEMARLADAGHWYPSVITLFISLVLVIWSLYALSGAKLLPKLLFLKFILVSISVVFLSRGVGFMFLKPMFPNNSEIFWFVSSSICFIIGMLYAIGTWQIWSTFDVTNSATGNVSDNGSGIK